MTRYTRLTLGPLLGILATAYLLATAGNASPGDWIIEKKDGAMLTEIQVAQAINLARQVMGWSDEESNLTLLSASKSEKVEWTSNPGPDGGIKDAGSVTTVTYSLYLERLITICDMSQWPIDRAKESQIDINGTICLQYKDSAGLDVPAPVWDTVMQWAQSVGAWTNADIIGLRQLTVLRRQGHLMAKTEGITTCAPVDCPVGVVPIDIIEQNDKIVSNKNVTKLA